MNCLGCFEIFQGPNRVAQFPTKAQVAGKRVELKRWRWKEAGSCKIPTPMLGFWEKLFFLLIWTIFGIHIWISRFYLCWEAQVVETVLTLKAASQKWLELGMAKMLSIRTQNLLILSTFSFSQWIKGLSTQEVAGKGLNPNEEWGRKG